VFCWGTLHDEETARRFSEIGVTDIRVGNTNQLVLALRYGMTPYCGTFAARGPHGQVMSPEEEVFFDYINGKDLGGLSVEERTSERNRRRIERQHRFGGEPDAPLDTINDARIPCFSSDPDYAQSRRALDAICDRLPGVRGVYFDYIGYSNFKGCYCESCLSDTLERELQAILAAGGDTLMVCNGNDMLAPGIFEVFRRYAGPSARGRLR
jgi:hypothetical protein